MESQYNREVLRTLKGINSNLERIAKSLESVRTMCVQNVRTNPSNIDSKSDGGRQKSDG